MLDESDVDGRSGEQPRTEDGEQFEDHESLLVRSSTL
jgi:hypothetical protein